MDRVELQWLWRLAYTAAIGGMGHMNADPQLNGENRELDRFAQELVARGVRNPVIIDVGANEGDFATDVLKRLPLATVHCFEPHPRTGSRLATRFAGNPSVTVNLVGVGAEAGTLLLHDYAGGAGSAHASFVGETFSQVWHATDEAAEVPVVALDEWLVDCGISRVDLVKIDVEGFERSVLLGMSESLRSGVIGRVQFEFNAHNALTGFTLHEAGLLLEGFDIFKILSNGRVKVIGAGVAYDSAIEIFKYANYIAIRRDDGSGRQPRCS